MENGNTGTDTATKKPETAQDYLGYDVASLEQVAVEKPKESADLQSELGRLLKATKVTEDGKFEYPADTPPWAKVAIANEKKFRDTQSAFTKTAQERKVIEAERDTLRAKLAELSAFTPEQKLELDELKASDPEAYFEKRTEYEREAKNQFNSELQDVRKKTEAELEIERRERYVKDFNAKREVPITQDVIENEVPAKFFKQLEANEVSFEEFLNNVADYLDTPKTLGKKEDVTNVTDLSTATGGTTPSKENRYDSIVDDYANVKF